MSMITIKEQCDNAWKMINSGDMIGAEHIANAMLTELGKNPEKNDAYIFTQKIPIIKA